MSFSAKSQEISNLKKQLHFAETDSSRIRLLFELGQKYEFFNEDSSIYFFNQSLLRAQQIKDQKSIARAMHKIGFIYLYYKRDESKAEMWLNRGILVAKKNNDNVNLANCYILLGVISAHQRIGNSLDFFNKALVYANIANDWKAKANCLENIFIYYVQKRDLTNAESFILKALDVYKKHDIDSWFSVGLDYCELLDQQGKFSESLSFLERLNARKKLLKQSKGYFVYMNDIGRLETKLKNYGQAEKDFLKILDFEKAKTKIDTFHLYFIFQNLETLYLDQGDYKKAWKAGKDLTEAQLYLRNKRQSQDARLQMFQQKANLELDIKEVEIALLESQKEEQLIIIGAGSIIVVLLLSFLFFLQRNSRKIETQNNVLMQVNGTKDRLFAILSHDLRSSIASLKNYLMLINWGGISQQEFTNSVNEMNEKVDNVHNMLENVLDWSISQMDGMHPTISKCFVYEILEEQIQSLKSLSDSKNIFIKNKIPTAAIILVDKYHLIIILRNLLQNALKFTHQGGEITFNYVENERHSSIEINDNGIGIPKSKLLNLFLLKTNTSSVGTNHEKGVGLGLVLVKELVEINNGKIITKSELGKGTTFEVSFPNK